MTRQIASVIVVGVLAAMLAALLWPIQARLLGLYDKDGSNDKRP